MTSSSQHLLELSSSSQKILEEIQPYVGSAADVFRYLMLCFQTPRPSKHLDMIRAVLMAFAEQHKLEAEIDKGGNVLIRKPAASGCETAPGVLLQAHIDVVTSKNKNVEHDFHTDPVDAYVEKDQNDDLWIRARGTTLGADDGMGVASAMAILAATNIHHGPLECLFTTDEEDDFFGVENLPTDTLKSQLLINLDSEDENDVCIGSAGGFEAFLWIPIDKTTAPTQHTDDYECMKLTVNQLRGGHTGGDIHRGYGNAIKITGRLLSACANQVPIHLVRVESGTGPSAIPREAESVFVVKKSDVAFVSETMKNVTRQIIEEYSVTEKDLRIVLTADETVVDALPSAASSRTFINAIELAPTGVIRTEPSTTEATTESSICLSVCDFSCEKPKAKLHLFARSSRASVLEHVEQQLRTLARVLNVDIESPIAPFPAWEPEADAPVVKTVVECYTRVMNKKPRILVVHGGLECGVIVGKYPHMQCVSIGPTILGAHSPEERLLVPSVDRYYRVLCTSLEALGLLF